MHIIIALYTKTRGPVSAADVYRAVKQRLKLHKTDTDTLIELYYEDRLMEQQRTKEITYGVLSVRAYYHHDSLCVEVLKAQNVIPLDPNGKRAVLCQTFHRDLT